LCQCQGGRRWTKAGVPRRVWCSTPLGTGSTAALTGGCPCASLLPSQASHRREQSPAAPAKHLTAGNRKHRPVAVQSTAACACGLGWALPLEEACAAVQALGACCMGLDNAGSVHGRCRGQLAVARLLGAHWRACCGCACTHHQRGALVVAVAARARHCFYRQGQ
jgi:hypothetical protein